MARKRKKMKRGSIAELFGLSKEAVRAIRKEFDDAKKKRRAKNKAALEKFEEKLKELEDQIADCVKEVEEEVEQVKEGLEDLIAEIDLEDPKADVGRP